jgi:hypothetical protein
MSALNLERYAQSQALLKLHQVAILHPQWRDKLKASVPIENSLLRKAAPSSISLWDDELLDRKSEHNLIDLTKTGGRAAGSAW